MKNISEEEKTLKFKNEVLDKLDLSEIDLFDQKVLLAIVEIKLCFQNHKPLQLVKKDHNLSFPLFIEAIKKNVPFQTLKLGAPFDQVTPIIKSLKNNHTITALEIYEKILNISIVNELIEVFSKKDSEITTLHLEANRIEQPNFIKLIESLKENPTITNITFKNSRLDDGGATAINELLERNTSLKSLNVAKTNCGAPAAKIIAQALAVNSTLTSLNMDECMITGEGFEALSEVLSMNFSLVNLSLNNNSFTSYNTKLIINSLKNNSAFRSLSICYDEKYSADDLKTIIQGVKNYHCLTELNFDLNPYNQTTAPIPTNLKFFSKLINPMLKLNYYELELPELKIKIHEEEKSFKFTKKSLINDALEIVNRLMTPKNQSNEAEKTEYLRFDINKTLNDMILSKNFFLKILKIANPKLVKHCYSSWIENNKSSQVSLEFLNKTSNLNENNILAIIENYITGNFLEIEGYYKDVNIGLENSPFKFLPYETMVLIGREYYSNQLTENLEG